MKKYWFYFILLHSISLLGQNASLNDTIKINEIVISSNQPDNSQTGFKSAHIDSFTVSINNGESLSEILKFNSTLFVKYYGPGGIATPAFRGTSASHTQIIWNGIPVNNPMLGQSDLNNFPSEITDDLYLNYGPNSRSVTNSGIGGSIEIENNPDWSSGINMTGNARLGSFNSYSGSFKMRIGTMNFQSVTRVYNNFSENNFHYINKYLSLEPVAMSRTNSKSSAKGVLQEIYYKKGALIFSARTWYQTSDRNLPQPVVSLNSSSSEKQYDGSFRTIAGIESKGLKNDFFITVAGITSKLNYSDNLSDIDSRNNTNDIFTRSGIVFKAGTLFNGKIIFENDYSFVKSNNYSGIAKRNLSTLALSAGGNSGNILYYNLMIREKADGFKLLVPDFSAGIDLRVFKDQGNIIKVSISKNSRVPSMNELFWNPGGNKELKNETAFIYELGYKKSLLLNRSFNLASESTLFINDITDMIHWHPGQSSYWIPENLKNIISGGIESGLKLKYTGGKTLLEFNCNYSFTRSVQIGEDINNLHNKQLTYIPVNQLSGSFILKHGNFYTDIESAYTGKRFLTADNSEYLPGYSITNTSIGYILNAQKSEFNFKFKIENIFNTYYEPVAFYPQPGIAYYLTINYTFSSK